MQESSSHVRTSLVHYVLAAVGYAVAACVLLFPIFTRGNGEIYSPALRLTRPMASWVMWILSWDVHALTSPATLFDANVFYPATKALAFGDPLLGLVPFFAPPYLLTGDPVFSYQVTLLATLALCGAGMFYLARHWGAGVGAAAVAGLLYAYCPAHIALLAELSHLSIPFLPLTIVFADRLIFRPRLGDAILLFVFASWQVLCGTQVAYASVIVLLAYTLVSALVRVGRLSWPGLVACLVAIGGSIGVLSWVTGPYRALVEEGMFEGATMYDLASFASADAWRMYLWPPFVSRYGSDGTLYLGLVAVSLALVGMVWAVVRQRDTLVPLIFVGVLCYWMSLGLGVGGGDLSLYALALDTIPGFPMLGPAPSRFVMFLMIPLAGLAAMGIDRLQTIFGDRAVVGQVIAASLCVAVLVDYRLPFQRFETERVVFSRQEMPLYSTLSGLPPGPVLEMPLDPCAVGVFRGTIDRQLASTLHWLPLLDGYKSQYRAPPTHGVVEAMANSLPDERVLKLMRRATGLRYVVVHLNDLPGDWRHRWRAVDGLTRLGFFGNDLLFEFSEEVASDLSDELIGLSRRDQTLTGVSLAKLDEAQRAANLTFSKVPPLAARTGERVRAELLIENRSDTAWPGLTPNPDARVYVSYLWADSKGELAGGDPRAQALPLDLGAGESVVVPVCVRVPGVTGDLTLAFGMTQSEEWFAHYSERISVSVIP